MLNLRAFYYAGPSNLFLENRLSPGWDFYAVSGNGSLYSWGNNPLDDYKTYTVAPTEYAQGQWSQAGSGWYHVCALPVGGGKPKVKILLILLQQLLFQFILIHQILANNLLFMVAVLAKIY